MPDIQKPLTELEAVEQMLVASKNTLVQDELMERFYTREKFTGSNKEIDRIIGSIQTKIKMNKHLINFLESQKKNLCIKAIL